MILNDAEHRDEDRVLAEGWPFAWTVPAPHWRSVVGLRSGLAHPRSELGRRERLADYAAQASLYAQAAGRVYRPGRDGARANLIIMDEITGSSGTRLHQLMEALGAERRSQVYPDPLPETVRRAREGRRRR